MTREIADKRAISLCINLPESFHLQLILQIQDLPIGCLKANSSG